MMHIEEQPDSCSQLSQQDLNTDSSLFILMSMPMSRSMPPSPRSCSLVPLLLCIVRMRQPCDLDLSKQQRAKGNRSNDAKGKGLIPFRQRGDPVPVPPYRQICSVVGLYLHCVWNLLFLLLLLLVVVLVLLLKEGKRTPRQSKEQNRDRVGLFFRSFETEQERKGHHCTLKEYCYAVVNEKRGKQQMRLLCWLIILLTFHLLTESFSLEMIPWCCSFVLSLHG